MSYVWISPVLALSGMAILLLIAIRRLPQVAALAGDDLKAAEAKRAQRRLNPSPVKRVFLGVGRLAKLLGSSVGSFFASAGKKIASVFSGVSRAAASKRERKTSDANARVVSQKGGSDSEPVAATADEVVATNSTEGSVDASADVLSKEELLAKEAEEKLRLERAAAQLAAQKQQHELVMELTRMEKDARKALLVNDLVTAESLYATVARKDANRVEVYRGLAEVYEKQGQIAKAQAALKRVLELDKHNTAARKKLEQLTNVPAA